MVGTVGRGRAAAISVAFIVGALVPSAASADQPPSTHGAIVSAAVHSDVSGPLRNAGVAAPSAAHLTERPLRRIDPGQGNGRDGAVQGTTGPPLSVTSGLRFERIAPDDLDRIRRFVGDALTAAPGVDVSKA